MRTTTRYQSQPLYEVLTAVRSWVYHRPSIFYNYEPRSRPYQIIWACCTLRPGSTITIRNLDVQCLVPEPIRNQSPGISGADFHQCLASDYFHMADVNPSVMEIGPQISQCPAPSGGVTHLFKNLQSRECSCAQSIVFEFCVGRSASLRLHTLISQHCPFLGPQRYDKAAVSVAAL